MENIEFAALFKASGWSQQHAAKRLWKDRASINRYLNGKIVPEHSVLELFKIILASEQPGVLTPLKEDSLADWERKVVEYLRQLHQADRERVIKTLRAMIDGLPVRPPIRCELKHNCRKCPPGRNSQTSL